MLFFGANENRLTLMIISRWIVTIILKKLTPVLFVIYLLRLLWIVQLEIHGANGSNSTVYPLLMITADDKTTEDHNANVHDSGKKDYNGAFESRRKIKVQTDIDTQDIDLDDTQPKVSINSKDLPFVDDQKRLIDKTDFRYIMKPGNYSSGHSNKTLLMVFVHSSPKHFRRRSVIRNTWGNASYFQNQIIAPCFEAIRVVFLVGESSDLAVNERLHLEHKANGDLVQGNFVDSYRNMTYKFVMGLKWASQYAHNTTFFLKTDDDVYVDTRQLMEYLVGLYGLRSVGGLNQPKSHLIACYVNFNPMPKRSYRSKWRVSYREFRPPYYPDYCKGFAVIMTPDVVLNMYKISHELPYFWIDDVFVTGILASRLGLELVALNDKLPMKEYAGQTLPPFDALRPERSTVFGLYYDIPIEVIEELFNRTTVYYKKMDSLAG